MLGGLIKQFLNSSHDTYNSNKQIFKFSPATKAFELTRIELPTPPKFFTSVWTGDTGKNNILLT